MFLWAWFILINVIFSCACFPKRGIWFFADLLCVYSFSTQLLMSTKLTSYLLIANRVAVKTHMQVSVYYIDLESFEYNPKRNTAAFYDSSISAFWGTSVLGSLHYIYYEILFWFLISLLTDSHYIQNELKYQCSSISISLITNTKHFLYMYWLFIFHLLRTISSFY